MGQRYFAPFWIDKNGLSRWHGAKNIDHGTEKWGGYMQKTSSRMPQNVVKYVATGIKYINVVLLLLHLGFALLFWKYEAWVLVSYQCASSFLLLFAYSMLRQKKKWAYVLSLYIDIFLFMILAVIYLGWEYGFQQYCISFVASFIFTDFYMIRERKISTKTKVIVAMDVLLYIGLRLWTYEHPYVYAIDNKQLQIFFYLVNSLVGFSFLIMYLFIYSNTVHRLENSLIEMANVDPLTGISNRRRMQDMLKTVLDEYENQRYQTVIAMLDIDHFKKINDTYGHDVGNELLNSAVRAISMVYGSENLYRIGGDEFVVFMKEADKNRCDALENELRDYLAKIKGNIKPVIAIGTAICHREKGTDFDVLFHKADERMYLDKKRLKESGCNSRYVQ